MAYTFDLSETKDVEAVVAGGFTFAVAFLSGVDLRNALLAAVSVAGAVVGYTGVSPAVKSP